MSSIIANILTKFLGSKSKKDLSEIYPLIDLIKEAEGEIEEVTDSQLRETSATIRKRITDSFAENEKKIIEEQKYIKIHTELNLSDRLKVFHKIQELEKEKNVIIEETLSKELPMVFAVLKETSKRFFKKNSLEVEATDFDRYLSQEREYVSIIGEKAIWETSWEVAGRKLKWDMVYYDVQLIGGIVLHKGKIAEMATGEGKTLVATLSAFLNGLTGKGVHIVTVNDYLAKRDCQWMKPLLEFHGLKVDCVDYYAPHTEERKKAYLADVTYGTNNEFGFDYLRDNMAQEVEQKVQRKHHYVMVDEVDSVLIDEARTPLIIAGPTERDNSAILYYELKPRVEVLVKEQEKVISTYLNEFKKEKENGNTAVAGKFLFKVYRGMPKFKPLIKILRDPENKQLLEKTENFYLQENSKMMPEADEALYFVIEEKGNTVDLTDKGIQLITQQGEEKDFFVLPDISTLFPQNDKSKQSALQTGLINEYNLKAQRVHALSQLLKAYTLFEKDIDYITTNEQVKIVDEQTGRVMEGRRYSEGLHQALEAKEKVKVEEATQTYASVTLQNYFRMYHKLSGMTGTAETEASEFWEIYKLDVVVIPTNKKIIRDDREDFVYRTMREKFNAIIKEVIDLVKKKQPILIGTTSVESSEVLSRYLKRAKINHQVLNAKFHAKEADIIMKAGTPSTVTIATNMAGRGTDIKLADLSKKAGGLAIIGTERHESRRIDRQLRGRSGRQGDLGNSQFFVSLEDNLMRVFASGRISKIMKTIGLKEGEVIQHRLITKSIERAQKKVEENNFSIRKRLLEYDNVMNYQREAIYKMRNHALYGYHLRADIMEMFYQSVEHIISKIIKEKESGTLEYIKTFGETPHIEEGKLIKEKEDAIEKEYEKILKNYDDKKEKLKENIYPILEFIEKNELKNPVIVFENGLIKIGVPIKNMEDHPSCAKEIIEELEKNVVLSVIDTSWKEHLREMDHLRQEVQNATIEQKDPLLVYKFESFELYKNLINHVNLTIVGFLCNFLLMQELGNNTDYQKRNKANNNIKLYANTTPKEERKKTIETIKKVKNFNRNEKVQVKYKDGTIKEVKYKNVEEDIRDEKCVVM